MIFFVLLGIVVITAITIAVAVWATRGLGVSSAVVSTPDGVVGGPQQILNVPVSKVFTNPIISGEYADVHAVKVNSSGNIRFFLTTSEYFNSNGTRSVPLFKSPDLVNWTLFRNLYTSDGSGVYSVNGMFYTGMRSPQIAKVGTLFVLNVTASRFATYEAALAASKNNHTVPNKNTGCYYAVTDDPENGFGALNPFKPAGNCSFGDVPFSSELARVNCMGACAPEIRADGDIFVDPLDSSIWLSYSWLSNEPTNSPDECATYYGQHISITELNSDLSVKCKQNNLVFPINCKINKTTPQNGNLLQDLATYCSKLGIKDRDCVSAVNYSIGKDGNSYYTTSVPASGNNNAKCEWCIVDSASMMRRNGYVYLFFSGGSRDSPNYGVPFIAAKSVPELADAKTRLAGQFIIPYNTVNGDRHTFGHGHPVQDEKNDWYFVYHHMNQSKGSKREVFMSKIEFVDLKDGLGDVWIRPVFPNV